MEQILDSFILDWNKNHNRFIFSAQEAPVTGRPVGIEIRYPAIKYQKFFSTREWDKLNYFVEARSHGTMYVVTDERLFERGIIEIKIASLNHTYQEGFVVGTLKWIYEEFFPNEDKNE